MRTGTTFPSEDEWWAEEDRHARRIERIRAAVRYAAVLAAAALLLFAVLWFFVRHWGKGHYDAWQSAAEAVRRRGGG